MNEDKDTPLVSVVIVNYNGRRFLPGCVASIERHVPVPHEIIVVDNDSRDGSAAYVRQKLPQVVLIESGANRGFAGGNNLGVGRARAEYILLLNCDAVLTTDVLPATRILANHPAVAIVGARMTGRNGEYRLSAGRFPEPLRLIRLASLYDVSGPLAHGDFTGFGPGFIEVDWVEGSFQLSRKSIWERVGGMDETYFMYVEDVDYCRAARSLGFATVYCPAVGYTHFGGYNQDRLDSLTKGFRHYHAKYFKPGKQFIAGTVLDLGLAARLLKAVPGAIGGSAADRVRVRSCARALKRTVRR